MTRTTWNTLAALALLVFTALPISAAETVTYYHNDHLGSPIAATDDTGTVVWQQAYDPWGAKLTVNTDERGYTGNWLDEETGLADHKARWYTSTIGRFTGIDPVKWHETNIHSFNRYAYGNNNPYSYADPDGELAFPVVPILGVMALEALGIGLEVATMEETSDSINRSGAGTFGVGGLKLIGGSSRIGLKGADALTGEAVQPLSQAFLRRVGQLVRDGRLVGGNAQNIRTISSGRLKGFTAIDTTATGGRTSAQSLFRSLSGRGPSSSFDRFVADDGLEVLFRGTSRTGTPKVEIVNPAKRTLEKVTFKP